MSAVAERDMDAIEKPILQKWLLHDGNSRVGGSLYDTRARMAGDEDRGHANPPLTQFRDCLESVNVRQVVIDDETAARPEIGIVQQLVSI
jgi:hypothetical protein